MLRSVSASALLACFWTLLATVVAAISVAAALAGGDEKCPYHYRPIRVLESAEDIPRALTDEEPFILKTGFMKRWPGWGKWSLEFFVEQYGSSKAVAAEGEYPTIQLKAGSSYFKDDFRNIVERVRKGDLVYGALSLNYTERRLLRNDFTVPPGMDDDALMDCLAEKHGSIADKFLQEFYWSQIFVGAEGTGMEMHKDNLRTDIWTAQITGEKQLVACNPSKSGAVYAEEYGDRANVNAFDPDMDAFPKFADADCVWGALQPGEILHWPSTWYHQSKNTRGVSLAVSGMSVSTSITGLFLNTLDDHIHSTDEIGEAVRDCLATSASPS